MTKASKPQKAKIKQYLKSKGHDPAKVDSKNWDTDADILASYLDLHGVTLAEYLAATNRE